MGRFLPTMIAALSTIGAAAPPLQDAPTEPAPVIFDTRADPAFGDATVPLRAYLDDVEPSPRGPQHFCIVGHRHPSGSRSAEVHWREGRRMILWEGASDPAYARDAIRMSRDDLDLTKDVVPTEADIAGSTYLVTQAWVDRVLADCAAKGTEYVIRR